MFRRMSTAMAAYTLAKLVLGVPCFAAEMHTTKSMGVINIQVRGDIERGDTHKLRKVLDDTALDSDHDIIVMALASRDGDIGEAMTMGRLIRSRFILTSAPELIGERCDDRYDLAPDQCVCLGACFFVWVAGSRRIGGVHIDLTPTAAGDPEKSKGSTLGIPSVRYEAVYPSGPLALDSEHGYERLVAESNAYLQEMSVPSWVHDRMLSIPSKETYRLTYSEVKDIDQPAGMDEWVIGKCGSLSDAESEALLELSIREGLKRKEQRALDSLSRKWERVRECARRIFSEEQRIRSPERIAAPRG